MAGMEERNAASKMLAVALAKCQRGIVGVIARSVLIKKAEGHADAKNALNLWLKVAKTSAWQSLKDIRRTFPATDMVGPLAIFNVRGNNYRLIVRMVFERQRIYIKEFLTHAEYDKEDWRKWL